MTSRNQRRGRGCVEGGGEGEEFREGWGRGVKDKVDGEEAEHTDWENRRGNMSVCMHIIHVCLAE